MNAMHDHVHVRSKVFKVCLKKKILFGNVMDDAVFLTATRLRFSTEVFLIAATVLDLNYVANCISLED